MVSRVVEIKHDRFNSMDMSAILLPNWWLPSLGIVFSILGFLFVKIKVEDGNVQGAWNKGNWLSMIMVAISSYS